MAHLCNVNSNCNGFIAYMSAMNTMCFPKVDLLQFNKYIESGVWKDFDLTTSVDLGSTGLTIVNYVAESGTTPIISTQYLKVDIAGWVANVELSNGEFIVFQKSGANTVYSVTTNTGYLITGLISWTTQDIYHYNLLNGFTINGSYYIPASQLNIGCDVLGDKLTNPIKKYNDIIYTRYCWSNDGSVKYASLNTISMLSTDSWNIEFYTQNLISTSTNSPLGRGSNASRFGIGANSFRFTNSLNAVSILTHQAPIKSVVKWNVIADGTGGLSVYANDILQSSVTGITTSFAPLYLGRSGASTYFRGEMWGVKIVINEITERYYPLSSGYETTAYDVSSNASHSNIVGGSVWKRNKNNLYNDENGVTVVTYLADITNIPYKEDGVSLYDSISPVINAGETTEDITHSEIIPNDKQLTIIAGQSNANGYKIESELAEVPSIDPNPKSRIWDINTGRFARIDYVGLNNNQQIYPVGRWGFELSFAEKYYNDTNKEKYIFKFAKGSTSLYSDWQPTTGYMNVGFLTSLKSMILSNKSIKIDSMIWYQGETDAESESTANAYFDNFTIFYNQMTGISELSDMKIYICILNEDSVKPYYDIVRAKQFEICSTYSNCIALDMNSYPLDSDDNHHTPQAYYDLGNDLADIVEALPVIENNIDRHNGAESKVQQKNLGLYDPDNFWYNTDGTRKQLTIQEMLFNTGNYDYNHIIDPDKNVQKHLLYGAAQSSENQEKIVKCQAKDVDNPAQFNDGNIVQFNNGVIAQFNN